MFDLREILSRSRPVWLWWLPPLLAAALTLAATWGGLPALTYTQHDLLGRFARPPSLPVVLVEVEGPEALAAAVADARAAGAEEVWMALPEGHRWLSGARPDPGALREGPDGRIHELAVPGGALRLPLPEALDGLLRLEAHQLRSDEPSTLLAGQDAVLVFSDPALGPRVAAPGRTQPVDRAALLAVGLGVARSPDRAIRVVPLGLAAAGVAWLTLAWSAVLLRLPIRRGLLWTVAAMGAAIAVAGVARVGGLDTPIGGLLAGLGLSSVRRLAAVARAALGTLDRVGAALVTSGEELSSTSDLAGLAEVLALYVPGCSVAAWQSPADGAGGGPTLVWLQPPDAVTPALDWLPADLDWREGWGVLPVRLEGRRVGALGLFAPRPIASAEVAALRAVASTALLVPEAPHPEAYVDPLAVRLGLVERFSRRAVQRAALWERLLGESGLAMGFFSLGGVMLAAGVPLRQRLPAGARNPLLALLCALTGQDEQTSLRTLRGLLAGEPSVTLPTRPGQPLLKLSPVGPTGSALGFLVELVEPGDAALDASVIRSGIVALGREVRNGLTALQVLSAQMALETTLERRLGLHERLESTGQQLAAALSELEQRERDDRTPQPAPLIELVRAAWAALPPAKQEQVRLELPGACRPIVARPRDLIRALELLMADATAQSAHVVVRVSAEQGGATLRVRDDAGGLPATALVNDNALGLSRGPAAAAPLVRQMGGSFELENRPGQGTTYRLHLPYA